MRSPFSNMLDALTKQRGVMASLVAGESDGMIVDSNLQVGQQGERVAALAASMFRKSRLAAEAAGLGAATFLQLEAERGRVCACGRNDLVLVVVSEAAANVGLIRVEMLKALGGLA